MHHVVDEPYVGSDGVSRSSFKIQDVFPAPKGIAQTMEDEVARPIETDTLGYEDPHYDDISSTEPRGFHTPLMSDE